MQKIISFFSKPYRALFLSALLSALPLTFSALFFLSWFSFVPFFFVILKERENLSLKKVATQGLFFGFFYHLFVYFWFLWLYPLDFAGFGKLSSLAIVLLAHVGIGLVHGALYVIPTVLCYLVGKKTENRLFLLFTAVLGVLVAEFLPSLGELAFPWVRLSLGQYRVPALIQFASVFGITGVDFLLLAFSALFTLFLLSGKKKEKVIFLSLALCLFVSNLVFGVVSLSHKEEGEGITVSLVQGNILSGEKFSGADWSKVYTDLTKENLSSDLIVWPESAIPTDLSENEYLLEKFQSLSREIDTPILLGCFWEKDGLNTNSALLVTADSVSKPYAKRHLVPFGEMMPYESFFSVALPFLEQLNLSYASLGEGEDTALFSLPEGKLGGIICFESLFPKLTRKSVQDGAEMIVLLTNDSWYEDSPAIYQHLAHAVFRSVENGRATLRCANSGVSAFISPKGEIQKELGPLRRGVVTDVVRFSDNTTLYTVLGDILLPALSCLWVVCMIVVICKGRRKERV